MREIINLRISGINHIIGFIESGIYWTNREKKNIFWKYEGFGISTPVLAYLQEKEVEKICVVWDQQVFTTTPLSYYYSGTIYQAGNDKQLVLSKNLFTSGVFYG